VAVIRQIYFNIAYHSHSRRATKDKRSSKSFPFAARILCQTRQTNSAQYNLNSTLARLGFSRVSVRRARELGGDGRASDIRKNWIGRSRLPARFFFPKNFLPLRETGLHVGQGCRDSEESTCRRSIDVDRCDNGAGTTAGSL
jgi:hypothetical protein